VVVLAGGRLVDVVASPTCPDSSLEPLQAVMTEHATSGQTQRDTRGNHRRMTELHRIVTPRGRGLSPT
jgi:hypothetical protein